MSYMQSSHTGILTTLFWD